MLNNPAIYRRIDKIKGRLESNIEPYEREELYAELINLKYRASESDKTPL